MSSVKHWASVRVCVCERDREINNDMYKVQLLKSFFTEELQNINID